MPCIQFKVSESLPPGIFSMLFCRLLFFFKNQLFPKILSGIPSECQTDWIQIRPDKTWGLIWFKTVCKRYQQTRLGNKELTLTEPIYPFMNL